GSRMNFEAKRSGMTASASAPSRIARLARFRVVALAILGLLALFAGISIWRIRTADLLPDIGDPFDVALALRPVVIPDHENAFAACAEARIPVAAAPPDLWDAAWKCRIDALSWSSAKPEVRAFQQNHRAALEVWREGSERTDALYHQPSDMAFVMSMPLLS